MGANRDDVNCQGRQIITSGPPEMQRTFDPAPPSSQVGEEAAAYDAAKAFTDEMNPHLVGQEREDEIFALSEVGMPQALKAAAPAMRAAWEAEINEEAADFDAELEDLAALVRPGGPQPDYDAIADDLNRIACELAALQPTKRPAIEARALERFIEGLLGEGAVEAAKAQLTLPIGDYMRNVYVRRAFEAAIHHAKEQGIQPSVDNQGEGQ